MGADRPMMAVCRLQHSKHVACCHDAWLGFQTPAAAGSMLPLIAGNHNMAAIPTSDIAHHSSMSSRRDILCSSALPPPAPLLVW